MERTDVDELTVIEQVRSGVFERSPDLIAAFERTGVIRWCNDAGLEMLGFRRDEVVGRSIADFLHPDDAERAIGLALAEVDHLRGAHAGAPYRHRRADGSYAILDINVTVFDDLLVAVGRPMHDHDLMDRVLAGLSAGEPLERVLALLPQFDLWRNPTARCVIRTYDDDGAPLVLGSSLPAGLSGAAPAPGSPWHLAVAGGSEVVDPDLSTLPQDLAEQARAEGLVGCRVLAIDDPRGYDPALITVFVAEAGVPIEAHPYPMATIARTLGLVLRFHHNATQLQHAATHDPLTGLLHRGGFFAALAERWNATPIAVLAVDLDGFKLVNDRHGHATGDEVLRRVAQRLVDAVDHDVIVARLGGDEFVLVSLGSAELAAAEAMAERVREAVVQPIRVGDDTVQLGATIGIAVDAGSGRSVDALMAEADASMYRAKPRARRVDR